MELAIQENPRFQSTIPGKVWMAVVLITVGAGLTGTLGEWWWVFAPLGLVVMMVIVFQPTWGLYFLIVTLFFPYAIHANPHVYPADLVVLFIVVGFWLNRARIGKLGFIRTPADGAIFIWLIILALSLVDAFDVQRGMVNLVRHVQLFLLYYAVAGLSNPRNSRQLIVVFALIAGVISIANVALFVQAGGDMRVFGIARVPFSGILILVLTYLAARMCFEPDRRRAQFYVILFGLAMMGQLVNQSRAAIGLSFLAIIIVMILAWQWSRRHAIDLPRRRALGLLAAGVVGASLVVVALPWLSGALVSRFMAEGNALTTLNYRYFLWKTALDTFLQYPILGIGLGQVQVWQYIDPSLRLQPIAYFTFGLGTHLAFLKYLAETGTVGALALLWLFSKFFRMAAQAIRSTGDLNNAGHTIGISVAVMITIIRAFVEGHLFYAISGMTTVLFFGLLIGELKSRPSEH